MSAQQQLPDDVDPQLWFEIENCAGRHYLVDGNPHTFHGRMFFYCPTDAVYTRVSKGEITHCSEAARYFVRGYLSGNEPPPPLDEDGDLLPEHEQRMVTWRRAVELFRVTGYWWAGSTRSCVRCGADLLPSEPFDEEGCAGCRAGAG